MRVFLQYSVKFSCAKRFTGPIIFSVCGGEVNFEGGGGGGKKADLIKGGIKFGRNMVRGGRELRIRPGGIRFLIIRMYNKVLNGQSKPCKLTGFAIRTTSCQTTVSVIYISPHVPDFLLLEYLKLSCGIHSFFLNLNFDFLEIIRS